VSELRSFDYAVVRVVPHVERGEYINAGVILFCRTMGVLAASVELDMDRLLALAPQVDAAAVQATLDLIPATCEGAGIIGRLSQSERFHWLVSPRSTVVQTSPVHCGLCVEPAQTLNHLMDSLVRRQ
jgi:hypothetical protein